MFNLKQNLSNAISGYDQYCEGYGKSANTSYIMGFVLGTGVATKELSHDGSENLDGINAYDKAEADSAYIGQINMTIVSSFCGPQGLIWGYDLAKATNLKKNHPFVEKFVENGKRQVPVYNANPLVKATTSLFGTLNEKRFPFIPGSHVPCAGGWKIENGPTKIYAAMAMGIPQDRSRNACLFMEDKGVLTNSRTKSQILTNLAKSILLIEKNQKIKYKEIFVAMKEVVVNKGQIGCALLAIPYFLIAKNALPKGNPHLLLSMNINKWENEIIK